MMFYCIILCVCVFLLLWNYNFFEKLSYSASAYTGLHPFKRLVQPEYLEKYFVLNSVIPNPSSHKWRTSRSIGSERKIRRFTKAENEVQDIQSSGIRAGKITPERTPLKDIHGIKAFVCLLVSLAFFLVNFLAFRGINFLTMLSAACFIIGMVYFSISQRGKKMYGVGQFTYKGFAVAAKVILLLYGLLLNQIIWSAILVYLFF